MTAPKKYLEAPDPNLSTWPKGIKYIIGNEGCERFSYYGMNAILYVYVVSLFVSAQMDNTQSANLATSTVHWFKTGVYAFPMIGAIIADRLLGKYKTILWLSIVYCFGHLVLSVSEGSIWGLYAGLGLIAIGSGGIKPCVSAHVGDQFGKSNWHFLEKVYQAFYFIINFGSFFAVLLIPLLQKWFGWSVAFAVPGILMFVATVIFWMGRHEFVHVPARPGGKIGLLDTLSSVFLFLTFGSLFFTSHSPGWVMASTSAACLVAGLWIFQKRQQIAQDDGFLAVSLYTLKAWAKGLVPNRRYATVGASTSGDQQGSMGMQFGGPSLIDEVKARFSDEAIEGTLAVLRIISVFFLVSIFWALFDQHSSSWIRQAEMMQLSVYIPLLGETTLLASQIPSMNPIMVMMLIPFVSYFVFPSLSKIGINMSPLRRMTVGMLIASVAFAAVAILQSVIDSRAESGQLVHVGWQVIPYLLITLAEVLVSVTGLEFAYSQAPKRMKSTVMGFWLLTVALGNVIVAVLAGFSSLPLVDFFWLFAGLMAVAGVLFGIRASFYKVRSYSQ